jgi:transposase InsO family protein
MTAYIESRRSVFGVEPVCRVLGVATSTHYARLSRPASARSIRDAELVQEISEARAGYRAVYGVRKTWKELRRRGVSDAGRERVARLMRQEGLRGIQRGKKRRTTTPDEKAADRARDLVNRDFTASRPNQLWVADLTYVRTWQGFSYLAFILDVYSRMICGWQLATHMRSGLVVDALEMAVGLRQPAAGELVAHTDRGSQYTSLHYTDRLDEHGIAPSVGSRGDAYDNAMAEAWVATYKSELVQGRLLSYEHLEHETLQWTSFYNHERLHEELGDVPPSEYEQTMTRSPKTVQPARKKDAPASVIDYKETTKTSLH